ncbi:MAG TPA: hypothetical protein VE863_13515 [Pyrinomonadaceae bacterium]|jgi:hypothetical protein|nr:hypothetical protein [Pyrinomonadaceae bacterium]
MTNEEMERKMEFIVETLARVAVSQERQELNYEKHDMLLSRLERIAKLMVRAGLRERKARTEGNERLKQAMAELAAAQKRTEESIAQTDTRLGALIDIVRQQQNGRSNHPMTRSDFHLPA